MSSRQYRRRRYTYKAAKAGLEAQQTVYIFPSDVKKANLVTIGDNQYYQVRKGGVTVYLLASMVKVGNGNSKQQVKEVAGAAAAPQQDRLDQLEGRIAKLEDHIDAIYQGMDKYEKALKELREDISIIKVRLNQLSRGETG